MGIPFIIGVTGHRNLREQDIPELRELVSAELKKLMSWYPDLEFLMLNSAASGADILCARIALELGMKLVCPLPMPAEEYRRDFSKTDSAEFDALIQKADDVFVTPAAEPVPENAARDFYYRQAGIYVASHSHLLLALWDGRAGEPDGCGTAETVGFVLNGNDKDKTGSFKAANAGAVLHILTPRQTAGTEERISVRLIENEPGRLREVLLMLDTLNANAAAAAENRAAARCSPKAD